MGTLFSAQAWKNLTKVSQIDLLELKVFAMLSDSVLPVGTELGWVWRTGPSFEGPF